MNVVVSACGSIKHLQKDAEKHIYIASVCCTNSGRLAVAGFYLVQSYSLNLKENVIMASRFAPIWYGFLWRHY
ncbi:MAG: hypothetical protein ACI832_000269 [Rheinheimera aquimaris]|jgi:uncharacterized protein YcsI (UPF0317 family)|nr:hypothetical protein [Rheinheimera sp.]|tara:strand:+ start:295 stop:513 length:219 start_codon:yes stop_codon:yes gene_type:complete